MRRLTLFCTAFILLAGGFDAAAVRLDPEGGGQALVYPFYSVRSHDANPYNTYVSVVNTTPDAKVLRVRFREGKAGVEVLGFNLYLSGNDTWTGALVPAGDGVRLVTRDTSCTNPLFASVPGDPIAQFSDFTASGYAADGLGAGIDRATEGYVEILEMGILTSTALAAVTPSPFNARNCTAVQGATLALTNVQAPGGGLQGTLTLINVASGMDMTVGADALADLATGAYYRNYNDPYPDFDAAEIAPVSHIVANGRGYRLAWSTGVQAVASVFMRKEVVNEFLLDAATQSLSDWIVTFPTRRLQAPRGRADAPFTSPGGTAGSCEQIAAVYFNRETQAAAQQAADFAVRPPSGPPASICHTATAMVFMNGAAHVKGASLLGSANPHTVTLESTFQNGWMRLVFDPLARAPLSSLPSSTSVDLRTGVRTTGAFRLSGLPVTGFFARNYRNGTLTCASGRCQGNYGSAYPHRSTRLIEAAP